MIIMQAVKLQRKDCYLVCWKAAILISSHYINDSDDEKAMDNNFKV